MARIGDAIELLEQLKKTELTSSQIEMIETTIMLLRVYEPSKFTTTTA